MYMVMVRVCTLLSIDPRPVTAHAAGRNSPQLPSRATAAGTLRRPGPEGTASACGVVWCGVVWCGVLWCAVV